jgi:3-oxoadipate enol-lactonase
MPEKDGLKYEKKEGEGKPLIFVHGWLGSRESWKSVIGELEIENPVILYDQRCHGESSCSEFLMEDLAEDIRKITEDLEEPVIIGHSMGGMAALQLSTISDNFSGLVLLATCASTPDPRYRSPGFFLEKLGDMARQKWAEIIADNYAEKGEEEMRRQTISELKQAGREPIINGLKSMIEYDVTEELEEESAVVVAGSKDTTIPPDQSGKVAELLNCEFQKINTTHLMLQDKPEKVAGIIENFVRDQ